MGRSVNFYISESKQIYKSIGARKKVKFIVIHRFAQIIKKLLLYGQVYCTPSFYRNSTEFKSSLLKIMKIIVINKFMDGEQNFFITSSCFLNSL